MLRAILILRKDKKFFRLASSAPWRQQLGVVHGRAREEQVTISLLAVVTLPLPRLYHVDNAI